MRRWRLADADWNHRADRLAEPDIWTSAAAAGVDGVEVAVHDIVGDLPQDRVVGWSRLSAAHGLGVVGLLLSLPRDRWPWGALTGEPLGVVVQARACAWLCSRLAIPVLGLSSSSDEPGAAWQDLVKGLTQVRDAVAQTGVRLAVEYKPGTIVATAGDALRLAGEVPGTGVLLDTAHAYAAGEDPAEVVRVLGDLLSHVHLGDAREGEPDDHLPLGQVHDFGPVVAALDASGYAGVATLDHDGASQSRHWTGAQAVAESVAHLHQ